MTCLKMYSWAPAKEMLAAEDQLALTGRVEQAPYLGERGCLGLGRPECGYCSIPENATDDRSPLQDLAGLARQAVQARLQDASERGGHVQSLQARQVDAPLFVPAHNDALLNEHLDQLFDVEGVPLGALHNQVAELVGDGCDFLQDFSYQSTALAPRKGS